MARIDRPRQKRTASITSVSVSIPLRTPSANAEDKIRR